MPRRISLNLHKTQKQPGHASELLGIYIVKQVFDGNKKHCSYMAGV
jgi:hypothetical protein